MKILTGVADALKDLVKLVEQERVVDRKWEANVTEVARTRQLAHPTSSASVVVRVSA
jgi:hypothetical protein